MKILFIEPYPTEGPSSRYRVEQYVPYFKNKGFDCIVSPFVSRKFYNIIYKKGFYFRKLFFFINSCLRRFFDLFRGFGCDIIFVHLEAFPFGPPLLEWIWARTGKSVIYDLDDAIYMGITSPANSFIRFLRQPSKIAKIISLSRYVVTCNAYLADYAKKFNSNIAIIHTSVDTDKFLPREKKPTPVLTIGWIGSHSTFPYLEGLQGVFRELRQKYKFRLLVVGAGDHNVNIEGIDILNKQWKLEEEVNDFQSLDIGVYPLPDNEWTAGKTGFKTIQYMSVGIPSVVSDVGTNRAIVQDGVNAFLAKTEDDWVKKLSRLIEDEELRRRMGLAGRETVVDKYSLQVNAPRLYDIIKDVYAGANS